MTRSRLGLALVGCLAFLAPRGGLFAGVASDQRLRLYDPGTGREVRTLAALGPAKPGAPAFSLGLLTFSADGRTLAAAGSDGTNVVVRLWDVASGKELPAL